MSSIVNIEDIHTLIGLDELFGEIYTSRGAPPDWQRPEGFESLVHIILEQQVSLQSAKAHFDKLKAFLPEFTPAAIIKLSDHEMRQCQVSRQKTIYLRELSSAILSGTINLRNLRNLPEAEVRQQLKSIKGIGDWTADIYLMFCLNSLDIIPLGDIAVVNTMKELLDIHTKEEMEIYTQKWKPYRSVATYFLWHYYLEKRGRKITY